MEIREKFQRPGTFVDVAGVLKSAFANEEAAAWLLADNIKPGVLTAEMIDNSFVATYSLFTTDKGIFQRSRTHESSSDNNRGSPHQDANNLAVVSSHSAAAARKPDFEALFVVHQQVGELLLGTIFDQSANVFYDVESGVESEQLRRMVIDLGSRNCLLFHALTRLSNHQFVLTQHLFRAQGGYEGATLLIGDFRPRSIPSVEDVVQSGLLEEFAGCEYCLLRNQKCTCSQAMLRRVSRPLDLRIINFEQWQANFVATRNRFSQSRITVFDKLMARVHSVDALSFVAATHPGDPTNDGLRRRYMAAILPPSPKGFANRFLIEGAKTPSLERARQLATTNAHISVTENTGILDEPTDRRDDSALAVTTRDGSMVPLTDHTKKRDHIELVVYPEGQLPVKRPCIDRHVRLEGQDDDPSLPRNLVPNVSERPDKQLDGNRVSSGFPPHTSFSQLETLDMGVKTGRPIETNQMQYPWIHVSSLSSADLQRVQGSHQEMYPPTRPSSANDVPLAPTSLPPEITKLEDIDNNPVLHSLDLPNQANDNGQLTSSNAQGTDQEATLGGKDMSGPPFRCEICNTTFSRKYDIQRHKKAKHENERGYHCSNCPAKFQQATHLKAHVKVIHEKVRDARCDVCGATFGTSSNMKKHRRNVHGEHS